MILDKLKQERKFYLQNLLTCLFQKGISDSGGLIRTILFIAKKLTWVGEYALGYKNIFCFSVV